MRDFDHLMIDLKARGVYTIARIVTFKDNVLATGRPDLAVTDGRHGQVLGRPREPRLGRSVREEVWAYNIAIAKEAVRHGFDEVQFDYVRFPTDGKLGAARYSRPNNKDTRLPAIAGFLERARRQLGPTGAFVAADIFGYTAFNENDTDIGQRIEELAPRLDYICPMVYPSGYHLGIPGFRNPVTHPYEVVRGERPAHPGALGPRVARVRPWLQDFRDYAFDRRVFGVDSGAGLRYAAQTRPAAPAGCSGTRATITPVRAQAEGGSRHRAGPRRRSRIEGRPPRRTRPRPLGGPRRGPSARPERARPRDDPRVPQAGGAREIAGRERR